MLNSMDLLESIKERSSVRSYTGERVPRDVIKQLIEYALWAPSSCNLQLTEYIIIDDQTLIKELAQEVTGKFNWASTYIVFIYDTRFTVKRGASLVSLGASMQNILLSALEFGLSACPMAGFSRDEKLKKILKIPDFYDVALLMSLGYAKDKTKIRNRIPSESTLHLNKYESKQSTLNDSETLGKWTIGDLINYRQRMAPVYLYNNRFRLQTFSEDIYAKVLEIFKEEVRKNNKNGGKLLDLVSYDSYFIKQLVASNFEGEIHASDYIRHVQDVLREEFPNIMVHHIDPDHSLDSEKSFDVITFIHKVEFSVDLPELFHQSVKVLNKGGIFFITTTNDPFYVRIVRKVRRLKNKYVDREVTNVYENSPYYKIGPFKQLRSKEIDRLLEKEGIQKVNSGKKKLRGVGYLPHTFYWAVYKK